MKIINSYKFFWIGFSLTSLFFYPLTQSLFGDGQYYMSWKLINTVEFLITFLFLFFVFSFSIYYIDKKKINGFKLFL